MSDHKNINQQIPLNVLMTREELREIWLHCDRLTGRRGNLDLIRLRAFEKLGRAAREATQKVR